MIAALLCFACIACLTPKWDVWCEPTADMVCGFFIYHNQKTVDIRIQTYCSGFQFRWKPKINYKEMKINMSNWKNMITMFTHKLIVFFSSQIQSLRYSLNFIRFAFGSTFVVSYEGILSTYLLLSESTRFYKSRQKETVNATAWAALLCLCVLVERGKHSGDVPRRFF